jgi:hypothetical protein
MEDRIATSHLSFSLFVIWGDIWEVRLHVMEQCFGYPAMTVRSAYVWFVYSC